ncbi:type II toxin-antitoxin system RelE/ParE family toxin [Avibacterium paragallinarum]|uniref:Plasmid stabilization system protein RelE-ParE family n=1 Tax=Avibacterium paragallinarum TaxID=728 RepID=H6U8L5_AVIPA|nr:type II toxin-antitoxin system RelE/ParE family toxin [Avibacterium paragallinarum]AFA45201.1 plasmid stabilization system protein RelE-ParE family [Avibacterium paragallinarum]KAA6209291.1 type II toxin-antitoxin system RelE/ParE family toxin [Avibacterium paragallinarum]KKB01574.1 plasmid stabilization protein [Avibacterium paragallinarum]QZP14827.1 type II toxin-antitoxin system RelE/ParE family toxin [Avibacterium paragallinarum]RZN58620.1 type II toxin-antitoxin system RelE/ParE family
MPAKRLIVTPKADNEIKSILADVQAYTGSIPSLIKLKNAFIERFNLIASFPKAGKRRDDGTRETFCRHYRIVYRESDDCIEIITVIHSRRKYPQDE